MPREALIGKELVARAMHERSPRRDRPLVKVNCASIPRELFESDFFGEGAAALLGMKPTTLWSRLRNLVHDQATSCP